VLLKRGLGFLTLSNYYPSAPWWPLSKMTENYFRVHHDFPVMAKGKRIEGPLDWNAIVGRWIGELPPELLFYTDIISVKPKKKREPALKTADTVVDKNIMAISLPMILIDQAADYILNSDTTVHLKYCTAVSDQLLQEGEEGRYDVTLTFGLYWRAYAYLFPHLKTADILRDSVPLCWVIRRDNDSLLQHCNNFLLGQQQKNRYRQLLKKYCDPESAERSYLASVQHLSPFGAVSRYDNQLQKYAEKYNLDWCLLAALIYQESRFKTNVVGRGNTFGLMQFKPATGSKYGVYASASAAQQIEGGCRYLNSLRQMLEKQGIRDSSELVSMMIAGFSSWRSAYILIT